MDRGEAFTAYIGAELKGLIASRGWSAAAVARRTGHSASALNRWLNGKQALPLPVLLEACDLLGVEPREVVSRAYDRLGEERGGGGRAGLRALDGETALEASGVSAGGATVRPLHGDDAYVEYVPSDLQAANDDGVDPELEAEGAAELP